VVVVVASDHHVPDRGAFCASVLRAAEAAAQDWIVTLGVRPAAPTTAYGYIEPGHPLEGVDQVRAVTRFVEKPDAETARAYVAAGMLWNSGNFVFKADMLLGELARLAPATVESVRTALDAAEEIGGATFLAESFKSAPKISIDYALMEKTSRAAVAPVEFGWSDLGAWDAVWDASGRDADGNAITGDGLLLDSRDCLVRAADGPLVVGVGLTRIAIVAEADALLICSLDASQSVKSAVDRLKSLGRPEVDVGAPAAAADPKTLSDARAAIERWLHGTAFPVWWSLGADHLGGGFHEALDDDGKAVLAPRRARVQARQVYSYAAAGLLGWPGPWRAAVGHGLDYMLSRYRRPDGLFRTLVNADGSPADDTVMVYDQAFVLFALASAAKATPERAPELRAIARKLVVALYEQFGAGPGLREAAGATPYQSNPHMHLLEASLAWEELDGDPFWRGLADDLVELALSRFIDPESGALREFFDERWAPAAGLAGRIVEPGHQFEWAWLLERWGRSRDDRRARAAARQLFRIGTAGVDRSRQVAVNALLDDLSVHDAGARLWPQTERLKAALILSAEPGAQAKDYEAEAVDALEGLTGYLAEPLAGLWRDKREPGGAFVAEPAPASSFYHIVCAIAELGAQPNTIRATEAAAARATAAKK
jgi:mannose/cellobiose epimerase-like protein (N-acyl-D-glucosamine 2-epimerase family)